MFLNPSLIYFLKFASNFPNDLLKVVVFLFLFLLIMLHFFHLIEHVILELLQVVSHMLLTFLKSLDDAELLAFFTNHDRCNNVFAGLRFEN